jgi:glycosyltransferase involved in cell wall biosynthesis
MPSMTSVARLVAHTRRHHISVIHTTDRPRDALASVVLARLTGARCVIHAHVGFDPAWMNRMLQWSMKRADGMIAISEFVASTLTEISRDPASVHVVLNAIDISHWVPGCGRDERRAEFGFAPPDTVITTVCRLFPGKGLTELVRAFALVQAEQPQTRLLIVGGEMVHGYLGELQTLASELGVADRVVFTGRRDDVPELMAASDIYAMPSMCEPFGLVYLEAMAMQLPVVALNNGGTPEVVDNGLDGLLSEPGDVAQLAVNLTALVVDSTKRDKFGRYGREQVESRFTLDRMARDTAAVYRMLVFHQQEVALGREVRADT